jgi:hypothetical protein
MAVTTESGLRSSRHLLRGNFNLKIGLWKCLPSTVGSHCGSQRLLRCDTQRRNDLTKQRALEPLSDVLAVLVCPVTIRVSSDRDGAVAEHPADVEEAGALGERQAGGGVAQLVELVIGQAGALEQSFPLSQRFDPLRGVPTRLGNTSPCSRQCCAAVIRRWTSSLSR